MKLNYSSIKKLKRILKKDYGFYLDNGETNKLDNSLLKIILLSLTRAEGKNISVRVRERNFLKPKTSA